MSRGKGGREGGKQVTWGERHSEVAGNEAADRRAKQELQLVHVG